LKDSRGQHIVLTHTELNLLLAFCEAPQRVLTRAQLLDLSDCMAKKSMTGPSTSISRGCGARSVAPMRAGPDSDRARCGLTFLKPKCMP
jgi:hypothetical protein